ncbi:hypothetical protein DR83_1902 [Francisella tularensis subsp. novicida]|nr:hypothetical protein DR83_1902 [Francisella tularensis subsp. novicida]
MMSKNAIVFGTTILCANSIKYLSQREWNILGVIYPVNLGQLATSFSIIYSN